jgi:hypothetical protein
MGKRKFLLSLLWFLAVLPVFSQGYPRGAVLDGELYEQLPQKAVLTSQSYAELPRSVSLKSFAPIPGDQAPYGTCVAWAAAYAARTISESRATGRMDRAITTENAFSPVFIYKNISRDPNCQEGTTIFQALDLMRTQGAVKMITNERSLDFRNIALSAYKESKKYPIAGYVTLFHDNRFSGRSKPSHIEMVKKSLAEGKPVIIGMNTPDSFFDPGELWRPRENSRIFYGGHALCVVGYDDDKDGGAFEVQNSWGRKWANGGYVWIPYTVFGQFVMEAYEIVENLSVYEDAAKYAGFARIALNSPEKEMPVRFTGQGSYQTLNAYPSGTEFCFLLENSQPAYVYAFAADEDRITQIFPPLGSNISPLLNHSQGVIAWPGEDQWLKIDDTPGSDFLVILYAKQEIDTRAIMARLAKEGGDLSRRLELAVGPDFIPFEDAAYENGEIRFSVQSENIRSVFALLLSIAHEDPEE